MKQLLFPLFLFIGGAVQESKAHAIFWEPPSRASLGMHSNNFCNVPVNYDHMSVYCGGIMVQHQVHGGKCGICGDPWAGAEKPHEVPGRYATGIIGRSYFQPGQVIDVIIDVVANHKGFFAFRLCPNNNPDKDPEPECFEEYPLEYEDGSLFFFVKPSFRQGTRVNLRVKLPEDVTCWQCILQWTYVAGNNWGIGPQTPELATDQCLADTNGMNGCGPQETFRGCADICIGRGCPKEYCQKARPFPGGQEIIPPAPEQLCIETGYLPLPDPVGEQYCKETCLNNPMDECNTFICYCNTPFIKQKIDRMVKSKK